MGIQLFFVSGTSTAYKYDSIWICGFPLLLIGVVAASDRGGYGFTANQSKLEKDSIRGDAASLANLVF